MQEVANSGVTVARVRRAARPFIAQLGSHPQIFSRIGPTRSCGFELTWEGTCGNIWTSSERRLFVVQAARRALVLLEMQMILRQTEVAAGSHCAHSVLRLALGLVWRFIPSPRSINWERALMPSVQSLAFFNEIGPRGRVADGWKVGRYRCGTGKHAATEQIDAIEALSVDSFKMRSSPHRRLCSGTALLTVFMDFAGLVGGYLAERFTSTCPGLYCFARFTR